MNATFTNEELLFLCGLVSGREGIGIENTLENENEESVAEKWKIYESILIEKGYIYYNELKQLRIKEEIGVIVKLITEAEYTFCCLQEGHEPEMQYLYYDQNKAMHMTNEEGECKVEVYSEYEPFKEKLCDVLQLNHIIQGEESYFVNFPAQIVDKALELEASGAHQEAMKLFEIYGLEDRVKEHLISVLVQDGEEVVNIKALHRKLIKGKEVLYKMVRKGPEGWLIKSDLERREPQIYVYKLKQEEMITALFNI